MAPGLYSRVVAILKVGLPLVAVGLLAVALRGADRRPDRRRAWSSRPATWRRWAAGCGSPTRPSPARPGRGPLPLHRRAGGARRRAARAGADHRAGGDARAAQRAGGDGQRRGPAISTSRRSGSTCRRGGDHDLGRLPAGHRQGDARPARRGRRRRGRGGDRPGRSGRSPRAACTWRRRRRPARRVGSLSETACGWYTIRRTLDEDGACAWLCGDHCGAAAGARAGAGARCRSAGSSHDASLPVEITSDAARARPGGGHGVFTGTVKVGQGTLRLAADRVEVFYDRGRGRADRQGAAAWSPPAT